MPIETMVDNGRCIVTKDTTYHFTEMFDRYTGLQITGNVKGSDEDPFMRSFPSLLDLGAMGSCLHGRSGLCVKAGVECYQSGLTFEEPHMSLSMYKWIIDSVNGKTFQVALGGRGDPNKHPHFVEMMKYARDNGVIPNYTTSGLGLTRKEVDATADFSGAVAVSWYRSQYTLDAIDAFLNAGCITNIHYVLGNNSIDEATRRLQDGTFPNVNAVIFLLHKPVGLGSEKNVLSDDDPRVAEFFDLVDKGEFDHQIGFDSCTIPGIVNHTHNINSQSIDTCEGGRFSAYISPSGIMTTCSFDQSLKYGVQVGPDDLTIEEAWNSESFSNFRAHFENSCLECPNRKMCYGGCPLTPQIVLCNRSERKHT
jgi:radical SAM protein with 4Fe4S-binding SPASM domain